MFSYYYEAEAMYMLSSELIFIMAHANFLEKLRIIKIVKKFVLNPYTMFYCS